MERNIQYSLVIFLTHVGEVWGLLRLPRAKAHGGSEMRMDSFGKQSVKLDSF